MKIYKLYVHINKVNGKRYYGITGENDVKKRWKNGIGYKDNEDFFKDINYYGWNEGFEHIVLFDNLIEIEAELLEQMYIALYDTNNEDKGYNITKGGNGGKLAINKVKQGKYNGGVILLGYKKEGDKLVIDESKKYIIQEMYNKYIQGGSKEALKYLESVGIKKVNQSLLQMIKNPTYKGYQRHNPKLYTAEEYEEINFYNEELQIVSEEVWNRANELIESRKTNRKGATVMTNRTNVKLEGLCYCGVCGGKLTLQKDTRGKDTKYILQCRKCKENKAQNQKNWAYNKIERLVNENLEQILAYEINKENLPSIKELYNRASEQQQKKLLQMLVNRIEIKGRDNIKVYLNY